MFSDVTLVHGPRPVGSARGGSTNALAAPPLSPRGRMVAALLLASCLWLCAALAPPRAWSQDGGGPAAAATSRGLAVARGLQHRTP